MNTEEVRYYLEYTQGSGKFLEKLPGFAIMDASYDDTYTYLKPYIVDPSISTDDKVREELIKLNPSKKEDVITGIEKGYLVNQYKVNSRFDTFYMTGSKRFESRLVFRDYYEAVKYSSENNERVQKEIDRVANLSDEEYSKEEVGKVLKKYPKFIKKIIIQCILDNKLTDYDVVNYGGMIYARDLSFGYSMEVPHYHDIPIFGVYFFDGRMRYLRSKEYGIIKSIESSLIGTPKTKNDEAYNNSIREAIGDVIEHTEIKGEE